MKSFSFVIIVLLCLGTIDCSKSLQFVGKQENATQSLFVVSIQFRRAHICCGSIVAPKWVLTAATCIKEGIDFTTVRYGVLDCNREINVDATTRVVVDQKTSDHNALSLLKVNKTFNPKWVRDFAKLPSSGHNISDHGLVFGWDETGETGNLLKCAMFYIKEKHSITNFQFKASGNDTRISQGNIGSPFVSNTTIIGIASDKSPFNGSSPDTFYLVSEFVQWIFNETDYTI